MSIRENSNIYTYYPKNEGFNIYTYHTYNRKLSVCSTSRSSIKSASLKHCQCIFSIFPASMHQFYANILVFVNINPFLYINDQFALSHMDTLTTQVNPSLILTVNSLTVYSFHLALFRAHRNNEII